MSIRSFNCSSLAGTTAIIIGLMVMISALLVPDTTLGWPTALIDRWYFSVAALAFIAFGVCARKDATTFGVLAFFLIVGGAAQLYVTDVGTFAALHLDPKNWKEWATVGVIACEGLAALIVLMRVGPGLVLREAQRRLGIGRLLLLALATGLLSVPVLGYVARNAGPEYFAHVVIGCVLMLIHLSVMAAMSLVRSPISGLYRLTPLVPATATLIVSLILTFMAFEAIPHRDIELAYQFQSRIFAAGALAAPAPPAVAIPGLAFPFLDIVDGRWFAAVMPGWPALLAGGQVLGVPWLVNPVLAALSVLLGHAIVSRLAGRDEADLVAMMMGASPWLLAMAASLQEQTLTLFLTLFAWWMVLKAIEGPRSPTWRLALAGLAIGWLMLTRPVDGMIIGGLTAAWLILSAHGSPLRALPFGLGLAIMAVIGAAYNSAMIGEALVTPVQAYLDRIWPVGSDRFGFGPEVGQPGGAGVLDLWQGHSVTEAMVSTLNLLSGLQFDLMGWSIGSLALFAVYLIWQRPNRADLLMMTVLITIIGVGFFYWHTDNYYIGPRYWFLTTFPLFYLSARGYQAIRARFPDKDELAFVRIDSLFWYACIFGVFVFLPWRAVTRYYEFGNFHPTVLEDAADGRFDGKVVLVAPNGDPGSTVMLNDPWLEGTVFLNDSAELDRSALAAAFPGRAIVAYANTWTGR